MKMGLKNLINGQALINMLEIGKIIRKMGLEFSIIKMEINIKEGGATIKEMDRAHIGCAITKNH